MRTTVDISEPILRKAKAKAALEGKKLNDVVNEALEDMLTLPSMFDEPKPGLPANTQIDEVGRFRIPVLKSSKPGKSQVSPRDLKDLELNEDISRYG
jgi:hypothetical protein